MKNMIFSSNKLLSGLFVGVFCCGMQMLTAMEAFNGDECECPASAAEGRGEESGRENFVTLKIKLGDAAASVDLRADAGGENIVLVAGVECAGLCSHADYKINVRDYMKLVEKVMVVTYCCTGVRPHVAKIRAKRECASFARQHSRIFASLLQGDENALLKLVQALVAPRGSVQCVTVRNEQCPCEEAEKCRERGGVFTVGDSVIVMPCGHAVCSECFETIFSSEEVVCPLCQCRWSVGRTSEVSFQSASNDGDGQGADSTV